MSKAHYSTYSTMESIITDDLENCYMCGAKASHAHHCIEGCHKRFSETYKLLVPLCGICHSKLHVNPKIEMSFRMLAQKTYEEKIGTREQFIRENGKSYL